MIQIREIYPEYKSIVFGNRTVAKPLNRFLQECSANGWKVRNIQYLTRGSSGEVSMVIVEYYTTPPEKYRKDR